MIPILSRLKNKNRLVKIIFLFGILLVTLNRRILKWVGT